MTLDTKCHIDSMIQTSLALEAEARAAGRYSKDCNRLNDALTRGQKSGVALLWGADGKLEVVSLNNGADHVHVTDEGEHVTVTHAEHHNSGPEEKRREETEEAPAPYEQASGKNWESAKANSHERENATKGRFEPQSHAADAARIRQMTADAKRFNDESYARNARIAAMQKAHSKAIHK
jgi:hypothetical protein